MFTDPATCDRKQFNDDGTFEPTANVSNESLRSNTPTPEDVFEEELDGVDEVAAPSSALSSLLLGRFRLENAVVSVCNWLERGSDYMSRIGSVAAKKTYGVAKSSRRRLQFGGTCISGAPAGNLAILALGLCAALILFSPIVTLVWKSAGIDADYVFRLPSKIKTVDALGVVLRGQQWARNKVPVIQQGLRFKTNGKEPILPEAMTNDKIVVKSTILDRLIHHKYTCLQLQQLSDPVLEDKMALSKVQWKMIKRTSDRICEQVQEIPDHLIEYYSSVRFYATDVYNRARYIQNVSGEKKGTSGKQTVDVTGIRQRMLSEAIPFWQKKFALLKTQGASLLQRFTDLQVDLSALKKSSNSAELEVTMERAKAIKELPWDRRFAAWTGISPSEPRELSGYTKALTLIGRWYSEASSLKNVLSEVYFEAEDLDRSIRDLVRKRMPSDTKSPWSGPNASEQLPYLTQMTGDIRRICTKAQKSKVMQRSN